MPDADGPRIVVTVAVAATHRDPDLAARRNARYAEAVARHGGEPLLLDAGAGGTERRAAFAAMDGLLLTGGPDIDPARYGRPNQGSVDIEPDRDELEASAFEAARDRGIPVLGICRGFQAINVFSGGTILQDVDEHVGPSWSKGPAKMHPIRVEGGRMGVAVLGSGGEGELVVNTYHHQAVTAADLAPGLAAWAWADSPAGPIVEALEATSDQFVVGVQCHPERTEFMPPEFARLWDEFVAACRSGSAPGSADYSRPASITR
jgi:putative glutamine amidotransferase